MGALKILMKELLEKCKPQNTSGSLSQRNKTGNYYRYTCLRLDLFMGKHLSHRAAVGKKWGDWAVLGGLFFPPIHIEPQPIAEHQFWGRVLVWLNLCSGTSPIGREVGASMPGLCIEPHPWFPWVLSCLLGTGVLQCQNPTEFPGVPSGLNPNSSKSLLYNDA